jgi:hypothetical protein
MISFEAARQALAVPVPGLSGYLMVRHGLRGWCGGVPEWPHGLDRCQITRAAPGTVLSFEMGLLWPGLMGRFGAAFGIPFAVRQAHRGGLILAPALEAPQGDAKG